MISEEQQHEHSPKETLYIQNINEKIKAKGTAVPTQTSSTPSSTSSKPLDRSYKWYASATIRCEDKPSSYSEKLERQLPPKTTYTVIPSLVSPW